MVIKGQKINDRYEIISTLGEGGMANVYLAKDVILDRLVAIKVLRGDLANDEKFVRRFQREALSASSLSHTNIVEMYDVGEDNGNYYIVMEYVEGKTLKQLLKRRGALTLSEAIDIMLQLTDGIAHAHDSYIIHRDIKPQNIMIKEDGLIKITDFGVAMALNSTQLTQTNSVMGTVHYLPPEQASGKGSTIKSDIYSMGILFYELLTGILPFKGENAVEIALKHMRDPLPSVRVQNADIPQSIENVILKATAKNPKNRYSDAKEMHDDLLTALDENRVNELRHTYSYPESDTEETKIIPVIKQESIEKNEKKEELPLIIDDETEEKTIKKTNYWIWILTGILGLVVVGLFLFFIIIPKLTDVPDIKIPDVTNMSVIDAETRLKEYGFKVNIEVKQTESDKYEKGKIVKTSPSIGRSVKKGSTITLYESLGVEDYVIEDYTGKNYIEIKTILETTHELVVTIEKKDIQNTETKEYGEQEIIGQNVEKGTKVKKGDAITLYIPNIVDSYPDMILEEWTLDDVRAFCDKYKITLTYDEQESSQHKKGRVMYQSRTPKTPIVEGSTLKVTIAKEVTQSINPGEPPKEDSGETNE